MNISDGLLNKIISSLVYSFFTDFVFIIVFLCTVKSIAKYISLSQNKPFFIKVKNKSFLIKHRFSHLVVSILSSFVLLSLVVFKETINDIFINYDYTDFYKTLVLCILTFILLIIQSVFFLIIKSKYPDDYS